MKLIHRMVYASLFSSVFLVAQVFLLTSQTALNYATSALTGIAERIGYSQLLDKGAIGLERRNQVLQATNKKHIDQKKALETKNKRLIAQQTRHRATVRNLSSKVARRTTRNVSASAASSFGEAVPYVGAGFVVAALTMDVMDGCSTMNDMNELMLIFTDENNKQHSTENSKIIASVKDVCATKIPSTEGIMQATEATIDKAGNSLNTGLTEAKEGWDDMTYTVGEVTYGVAESLSMKMTSWKDKWTQAVGGTIAISIENTQQKAHNAGKVITGTSKEVSRRSIKTYDKAVNATSKAIEWLMN